MRRASAALRARGFSQAMPTSFAPRERASTMRSMFSMRAWLGPQIQMQSISGAATISSMEAKARASPTRRERARAAASSAWPACGLHTPRTSASRTAIQDLMWNRVMNPLPMNPTPRRPRAMPCLLDEGGILPLQVGPQQRDLLGQVLHAMGEMRDADRVVQAQQGQVQDAE